MSPLIAIPLALVVGLFAYAWYQASFVLSSFPRLQPPAPVRSPKPDAGGCLDDRQLSIPPFPANDNGAGEGGWIRSGRLMP